MKTLLRAIALASISCCAACSGGSTSPPPVASATATPSATPSPAPSATPVPSASPTASPTPTPTSTPTATPVPVAASPSSITFASNAAVTFAVAQPGYSGAFTESDTCAPLSGTIATVAATAGSKNASYSVTPQSAGTCAITVTGGGGSFTTVPVTVSAAAIVVQ